MSFLFFFSAEPGGIGILAPRPGTEPTPPALEAQGLNHWTAREVPERCLLYQPAVGTLDTVGELPHAFRKENP